MLSERTLRDERKRLPKIMQRYIEEHDLESALEIKHLIESLDWILNLDEAI